MVSTILFLAFSLLEYWLGKTKLIKSNSTIELIMDIIKAVVTILLRRKL